MQDIWSSKRVFLLATIGSAVGLGNFWRFPFIAGENGGSAFVIVYLGCVLLLGIPLLIAELTIGRLGARDPVGTMQALTQGVRAPGLWRAIGWISVLTPMLAVTAYGVVAGWAFDYAWASAAGERRGADGASSQAAFDLLLASPGRMYGSFVLFVVLATAVVARGLKHGIERAINAMMPAMFLLIAILLGYSALTADFAAGLAFMFAPDFSKLDTTVILIALGQAFFSLSIGMGATLTYGAYLGPGVSIPRSALTIALVDTLVSIAAGLVVFPLVFANELEVTQGPGLVFVTLPLAFAQMPGGQVFGALFFLLFAITGLTTAFALLEPAVAWVTNRTRLSRTAAAALLGAASMTGGIFVTLSFNHLSEVRPLSFIAYFREKGIFDVIDFFISNVLLPVCGLLLALFAGWVLSRELTRRQFGARRERLFAAWRFLIRYAAPAAVAWLFLEQL